MDIDRIRSLGSFAEFRFLMEEEGTSDEAFLDGVAAALMWVESDGAEIRGSMDDDAPFVRLLSDWLAR